METVELFNQYVVPNYGRFPLQLSRGKGCRVWDEAGKEYLDFGAGIAVTSVGHCHPRVVAALTRQLGEIAHTSNLYYTRSQGELAQRLVNCVGAPGKVFFCNSGAEANEALFKLARKFGNETVPPPPEHTVGELVEMEQNRFEIITFKNSFHGRTLAGIAATGQEKVKRGFEPMTPGFIQVPFNDAPALMAAISSRTIAVLLEPIQGEIGVQPADAHFLKTVRSICDDYGLLMMFDEIQCGLGRTGDWCGWRSLANGETNDGKIANSDLLPDAISWAKGLGGGFPIGAIWARDKKITLKTGEEISLADLFGAGSHGTTFGGAPLACVGATEVLSVIQEEGLLANAEEMGAYLKKALREIGAPFISEVRGVGLMIGFDLAADFAKQFANRDRAPSLQVIDRLHGAGMLSIPSGTNALRWLPPLNVTRAECDEAVEKLRKVLLSFEREA